MAVRLRLRHTPEQLAGVERASMGIDQGARR
jgi:hypothetical protein